MPSTYIIVYDTYCGWCYGAQPILQTVGALTPHLQTYHRYLFRDGTTQKMADGFGAQALRIDARIQALSQQPFSDKYKQDVLRNRAEVLESGLTAQAAVLVKHKGPVAELRLMARLQTMRYVDGVGAADRNAVIAALLEEGVDPEQTQRIGTRELEKIAVDVAETAEEFLKGVGGGGVPALIRVTDSGALELLGLGKYYGRPEAVQEMVD